ncbi:MAG TPA: hypothetical protein PKB10_15375, partial [Tepidisphaeraceae bacterium]|nr:hypothetical protein [Tepidisphaeraceae bacterium]
MIFTVTPYLDSVTFGEVKRKLECRLVRQGEDDVEYELKSTPADGGIPETKRIVFKGAPVVVFENAAQRITLQFQGSTRVVGTVYGKPVTAGDIGMAKTINPDVEFDAQNRALWEQTGRILRTFGKPVEDAFVAERQLTFTDDDIAKYRKWVRWSNAQALNWC